jgi:HSP20 family molecular chaperone IbpA
MVSRSKPKVIMNVSEWEPSEIKGDFKKGLLKLTLPGAEKPKPMAMEIKVG